MIPLAADLVADGVWIADLSEQAEDDDGLCPPASADVVAPSAERPAPPRPRVAWLPVADDPVAAGWTRLTVRSRSSSRLIASARLRGFRSVTPALAHEYPLLHQQVMAAADARLDEASCKAKMLAAEGDALHQAGKHDESIAKYEETAKGMGITLTHKAE